MLNVSLRQGLVWGVGAAVLFAALLFTTAWAGGPSVAALSGYCPVCVVKAKQWVRGAREHAAMHDGRTYWFPSAAEKAAFEADPAKFTPALGGDCVVCYAMGGKRVPGSVQHSALHNGRLYLFPSDQEKQVFLKNPTKFENVDLANQGNCIVCQVKAGKKVPGKPEYTAIHNGFRYQFPSARERNAFAANPEEFVAAGRPAVDTSSAREPQASSFVTVQGTSGCAACGYGKFPLHSPKSLGLAVATSVGKVYIVEGGEKNYPQIYKRRFDGLQLQVAGKVIKQSGKFAWIEPSRVEVMN